jgi:hypothetical protein
MIFTLILEIYNYNNNKKNNTAYSCHLVGFIYGFCLLNTIYKPEDKYNYQKYLKFVGIIFISTITPMLLYDYITLTTAKENRFSNQCCYIG